MLSLAQVCLLEFLFNPLKATQSLQMLMGSKISFVAVIQWHFTSVMCSVLKKIKEEQHSTRTGYPYVAWMWKILKENLTSQYTEKHKKRWCGSKYTINTSS